MVYRTKNNAEYPILKKSMKDIRHLSYQSNLIFIQQPENR